MQTYRMGNKQEMVVAVHAPEGKQGPIEVALTTDVAQDLFLHWGVRKQGGGDWMAPPKVLDCADIWSNAVCNPKWSNECVSPQVGPGLEVAVGTGIVGPLACHFHSSRVLRASGRHSCRMRRDHSTLGGDKRV